MLKVKTTKSTKIIAEILNRDVLFENKFLKEIFLYGSLEITSGGLSAGHTTYDACDKADPYYKRVSDVERSANLSPEGLLLP